MQEITLSQSFFGKDYVPPRNKDVYDALSNILEEERGVSEKSFSEVDKLVELSKKIVEKNEKLVDECRSKNQRIKYIAEQLYDSEFNSIGKQNEEK